MRSWSKSDLLRIKAELTEKAEGIKARLWEELGVVI
jgi:hypothetical protein